MGYTKMPHTNRSRWYAGDFLRRWSRRLMRMDVRFWSMYPSSVGQPEYAFLVPKFHMLNSPNVASYARIMPTYAD